MDYSKIFKTDYSACTIEDLHSQNYGLKLLDDKKIDYPLYKAISLIIGYKKYRTHITHRSDLHYTNKELINKLFKNVFLWYKRSDIKLPRNLEKTYIQKIKDVASIKRIENLDNYNNEVASRYVYRLKNSQRKQRILAS